jgi:hypothetical protein
LLISVRWGQGEGELVRHPIVRPNYSFVAPEQQRQLASPLRIRADSRSGWHVLNLFHGVHPAVARTMVDHFSANGAWQGRTVFQPSPPEWESKRVVDFAVDPERHCYTLEQVDNAATSGGALLNVLSKHDANGALVWRRQGRVATTAADFASLSGRFTGLFAAASATLCLTTTSPAREVGVCNAVDGSVKTTQLLPEGSEYKVFVTPSGQIRSVLVNDEKGCYAMAAVQADGQVVMRAVAEHETAAVIQFACGADDDANFFALMPYGDFPRAGIARVPFQGAPVLLAEFKDIVVGPSDQAVHLSSVHDGLLEVTSHFKDGSSRQCALSPVDAGGAVLIAVDSGGRYLVLRNEGPGQAGEISIYSPLGELESVQPASAASLSAETACATCTDWVVDGAGAICLPLADSHGFKVVRIAAA